MDTFCDRLDIPGLIANDKISSLSKNNSTYLSDNGVGINDMTFNVEDNSFLNESGFDVTKSVNGSSTEDPQSTEKEQDSESLAIIKEMSQILNTQLSSNSVKICLRLIEEGADYNAVSQLLKNWRCSKIPNNLNKSNIKSSKTEREWRT